MCFAKLRAVDAIDGIRNARKMKKYYGFKGWTINFFLNNIDMKLPSLESMLFFAFIYRVVSITSICYPIN